MRTITVACDFTGCTETAPVTERMDSLAGWITRDVVDSVKKTLKDRSVHHFDAKESFHYCPKHGLGLQNPPTHPQVVAFVKQSED